MAPSVPETYSTTTMAASEETTTTAADMLAELQFLRNRNQELQSQVEKLTTERDLDERNHEEEDIAGGEASSSFSLDSGLELMERIGKTQDPVPLVRSSSISLEGNNSHNGLHHRRVSGKENAENDKKLQRKDSPSRKLRECVKSKVSDIDITRTPSKIEHLDSVATPDGGKGLSDEASFENECKNSPVLGKILGSRRSTDGAGRYVKACDVDVEEGHFPDLHIKRSSDLEDDDTNSHESDNLVDDDSHNKHLERTVTPTSIVSTSNGFEPFKDQLKERAGWLIGLLFLQSCSSFIIQYNQSFLQSHMVIVQFLTMLVGAGGNAGNQASVRVIRSLALGTLNSRTMKGFLVQEAKMALSLSALIGLTGFIRAALFRTPAGETIAVTASVCAIVAISVAIGSTLPLGMKKVGIDPAHSSTTIQVVMDILGVLITVCVSSVVLSFKVFQSQNDDTGEAGEAEGDLL